jgi:hypothetical protein
MARRSLKPQLNQIRAWVRQGRTDAWIAHQLEVTVVELREFRDQHGLTADDEDAGAQEVDLRDEIEAEIEAATAEEAAKEAEEAEAAQAEEASDSDEEDASDSDEEEEPSDAEEPAESGTGRDEGSAEAGTRPRRRRRRGKRGRGRRKDFEGTFDHGERDGYGLWLDAAIKDNPIYAEHWAGKRDVTVRIESDQIVIRRAGEPEPDDSDE